MALKLWKRKRPPRERKPLKEVSKIAQKVFDDKTVAVLVDLINTGAFKSLDYPVASGKEAMVFRATRADGSFIAVKAFKYETTAFRHAMQYVEGDPRFVVDKVRRKLRDFVKLWARKEFSNLQTCFQAGVRVPEPLALKENVVLMEFLGERGVPYALLEEVVVENPRAVLEKILADVKKAFRAGIVHADLSAFNVVMKHDEPFLIDWGQGVSIEHPCAREFLEKDVSNILKYFARLGVKKDFGKTLKEVAGIAGVG